MVLMVVPDTVMILEAEQGLAVDGVVVDGATVAVDGVVVDGATVTVLGDPKYQFPAPLLEGLMFPL